MNYLVAVGHKMFPSFLTFPTRTETRGTHRHLANIPTSDASKCWPYLGTINNKVKNKINEKGRKDNKAKFDQA